MGWVAAENGFFVGRVEGGATGFEAINILKPPETRRYRICGLRSWTSITCLAVSNRVTGGLKGGGLRAIRKNFSQGVLFALNPPYKNLWVG